jgi:hypothetical protein
MDLDLKAAIRIKGRGKGKRKVCTLMCVKRIGRLVLIARAKARRGCSTTIHRSAGTLLLVVLVEVMSLQRALKWGQ